MMNQVIDSPDTPPAKPRRQRTGTGERRSELARIAYNLIAQNGLEGFRTRQVAAAANIDSGTLHYHFPSKEALIQAVVDHLIADFRLNRAEAEPPRNALDELRSEIRDVGLRVRQSPEQFRVLIDLRLRATRDPDIAEIMARQDRAFHRFLAGLLARGIDDGTFRPDVDPDLAALVLRTEMAGLSLMALVATDRIDEIALALCGQMELWLVKPSP